MRFVINSIASFLLVCSSGFAQPHLFLNGPTQARYGLSTTVNAVIVRNQFIGPARLITELPDGWQMRRFVNNEENSSQVGSIIKTVWFDFPAKDTLNYSILLYIPENFRGDALIKARLEYFSQGEKKSVQSAPFIIDVRRYYSRL